MSEKFIRKCRKQKLNSARLKDPQERPDTWPWQVWYGYGPCPSGSILRGYFALDQKSPFVKEIYRPKGPGSRRTGLKYKICILSLNHTATIISEISHCLSINSITNN